MSSSSSTTNSLPVWSGRLRTRTGRGAPPAPGTPKKPTNQSLIATLKGPCNPQRACVFFATIPAEIRNNIFSFALYAYDDKSRPYPSESHYSRPGYRFHRRIDTALLATCRRIYDETHDLPISQNEHVFWCGRGPSRRFSDDPTGYFNRFTEEQKAAVVEVHFFTQLYWLEHEFLEVCRLPSMRPKHMKITVRHGDWWNWEDNRPLSMKSKWVDNLKFVQGLESLEVELESIERDKAQLESIAQNMSKWRISLADRVITTEGNTIQYKRHQGPARYQENRLRYSPAQDRWVYTFTANKKPKLAHLSYVTSTLLWTSKVTIETQ